MYNLPRLCLLLAALGLAACAKDDPEASLPEATRSGLNTGGCLINGQAYVATATSGGLLNTFGGRSALSGGYYWDVLGTTYGSPSYIASRPYELDMNCIGKSRAAEVSFYMRRGDSKTYPLNVDTKHFPTALEKDVFDHATVRFYDDNGDFYTTSARHTGQLQLTTSNAAAGISAGTFEFTAASVRDSTRTVRVTLGRFDRKQGF